LISEPFLENKFVTRTSGQIQAASFFLAALLSAACSVPTSASAEAKNGGVDYAHLADLVVNRSWRIAPGERVVFFWDASRDRGMAAPLRAAVERAGGQVEEIAAPDSRTDAVLTAAQKADRFQQWSAAFQRSQAAIWLPSDLTAVSEQPFEHLVEASHVRSIHFHWFLPPDGADVPVIETMYQRAIEVDPKEIGHRIAILESAIRGHTIHVTAPNGTDFRFRVPADAHVHRNTGEATKEKAVDARSVRDREEELPASVLRTTDLGDAQGTFVGYVSFDTRSGLAKVTFKDGRVTSLESLRGAESEVRYWKSASGAKDKAGEFVIGTNPALTPVLKSGYMPYYGYAAGVVRLSIGDNWESGGRNRSSNGEFLLFLPGATLSDDENKLIEAGTLATQ
jgi:leucyl aminopeptidase (aminopeptidase T)